MSNDKSMLSLVHLLAQFQSGRRSDLFHQNNLKKKAKSYFERMLKDVPNVYTQHKPHVFEETIPDIITKKIK
jgi:vacuolar protein sorting-associated protein 45